MLDAFSLSVIVLTFLLAGAVKGTIGLGLPTVSLALLAVVFDLPTAMALLLVPSFVTNLWQASVGGNAGTLVKRLWPFLASATLTVWLGALFLSRLDSGLLTGLLGTLLMTYAAIYLLGVRFGIAPSVEVWSGPLFGMANGILTGMTGSFVVPGVLYLQALDLDRTQLVQAMGLLFSLSTLALAIALFGNRMIEPELAKVSAISLVPALAGMWLGQRFRHRLSENQFRRLFFISLLIIGGYILFRSVRTFTG